MSEGANFSRAARSAAYAGEGFSRTFLSCRVSSEIQSPKIFGERIFWRGGRAEFMCVCPTHPCARTLLRLLAKLPGYTESFLYSSFVPFLFFRTNFINFSCWEDIFDPTDCITKAAFFIYAPLMYLLF